MCDHTQIILLAVRSLFDHGMERAWRLSERHEADYKNDRHGRLLSIINILVTLDENSIALIAILSGIAGSAATFLFAPRSGKE